jgi:TetR/AcrR family transcriptional regulator, repressor for neighboring sulfatase
MKTNPQNQNSTVKTKRRGSKNHRRGNNIPYGRDEVKSAILDAAEKLLMERSPNEITVREIAKLANIKHPLIHRHFGTKDELVIAVHARSIEKTRNEIGNVQFLEGNIEVFFRAVEKNRFRQIALARAMLDGVDPYQLQNQFPVMQMFLKLVEKKQAESTKEVKFDSKIVAAVLAGLALGWMVYEPFLLVSTGLDQEDKEQIKQTVGEILEEFIRQIY